jgi:hypothetical protein
MALGPRINNSTNEGYDHFVERQDDVYERVLYVTDQIEKRRPDARLTWWWCAVCRVVRCMSETLEVES